MRVVFAAAGWKGGREVGRALRGRARGAPLGVAAFFRGEREDDGGMKSGLQEGRRGEREAVGGARGGRTSK